MEGDDEQQQHQHQQGQQPPHHHHHHHMHPPPPQPVYGYPMDPSWVQDPSWGAHGMVALHQGHHGFHPMQHLEGVPLPPGIPGLGASTDPLEAILGTFPCARLRHLPFEATIEDILVILQGLVVIDVVIVGSGEAFVIFSNPMDYQMALQRERVTMGRQFVEIGRGSRAEYYGAIATLEWREKQIDPKPISTEDLTSERELQLEGVSVWGSAAMPPTQSLTSLQGPEVGRGRGQPGGPAGARAFTGKGVQGQQGRRTGGGIQIGEHTGFLRMRGLPFSASKSEIMQFFEGYNPVIDSIVLTYRSDGRATGEAYVGFEGPDEAKRAMDLHRKTMGTRYIELFISNKEEHGRALARFGNR